MERITEKGNEGEKLEQSRMKSQMRRKDRVGRKRVFVGTFLASYASFVCASPCSSFSFSSLSLSLSEDFSHFFPFLLCQPLPAFEGRLKGVCQRLKGEKKYEKKYKK